MASDCVVLAGTGDNVSSCLGLQLAAGEVAISFGTSDVLFGPMRDRTLRCIDGMVLCYPDQTNATMVCDSDQSDVKGMIVKRNGSLAREKIRDMFADGSWSRFEHLLQSTSFGNDGATGFYYFEREIVPPIAGVYYFQDGQACSGWSSPEKHIRAIIESQLMSLRMSAKQLGLDLPNAIVATGGASRNRAILQVMADVFGVPVYVAEDPNSAVLGAVRRALEFDSKTFRLAKTLAATPTYPTQMEDVLSRYQLLENSLLTCSETST